MRKTAFVALAAAFISMQGLAQTPSNGTLLYSFRKQDGDAGFPVAGVVRDAAGNLYGTERGGGPRHERTLGSVYELSPPSGGQTRPVEAILHTFAGADGYDPYGGLIIDRSGNLYGTAGEGGGRGHGVAFELSRPAAGQTDWTYTIIHDFGGELGSKPLGSLLMDGAGALFGTTDSGGAGGYGTVFQLKPPAPGETVWKRRTLYSFTNSGQGCPHAALISGANGTLYGTTFGCGYFYYGNGTVFELTPGIDSSAPYIEKILYDCASSSLLGSNPNGPLIMDGSGVFYGTTSSGQKGVAYGAVFASTPPGPGSSTWAPSLLHGFSTYGASDGAVPEAGLLMDSHGNLYGTTSSGGNAGTVFKLTRPAPGQTAWSETFVPLSFTVAEYPLSSLVFDGSGTQLIGTAQYGGLHGYGSILP